MLNILKYNLYRFSKLKISYVFLFLCVICGGAVGALTYMSSNMSGVGAMPVEVSIILSGTIIPLFFSNEFKDGIVRNQLIMGSSHSTVYIADSIFACVIGSIYWFAYILPNLVIMAILGVSFDVLGTILGLFAGILCVCSACCAFVFISFRAQNSIGIIICILLSSLMCVFASLMTSPLATLGVIKEPTLSILTTCLRVLPISQLTFAETFAVPKIWIVFLSSILFIVAFELIGIVLFKKSDIK